MSDLIERQAALDCFHDWIDKHGDVHTADEMPEYRAIESLTSVQPEIIRCKDCKRYGRDDCFMKIQMLWELKPDDFCSCAERRNDE